MKLNGNLLTVFLVFFPFAAGLAAYIIGQKSKKAGAVFSVIAVAAELLAAVLLLTLGAGTETGIPLFAGFGLSFKADGFRTIMAALAGVAWLFVTIQSIEYFNKLNTKHRNRFCMFSLWTLGAVMGIFLSSNLYTTFIFFEIMSFTSWVLVAHRESKASREASDSYLAYAVLGGLVTLMGLFILDANIGTLEMSRILPAIESSGTGAGTVLASGLLILFGFGVKAGMYPLHTWLPKSYVEAPDPATALLSSVLSKCGIYGIFVITADILLHNTTWGIILLILGLLTMLTGALLACFSVNFKRTLACSSMSQIGFILVGCSMQALLGEHNAIAAAGTVLHTTNHLFIKLALFMVAGVIFMNLKEFDLNKIRGWGRKKWFIKLVSASAILGVAGIPLFNGYISKTLIHESMVEYMELLPAASLAGGLMKFSECLFLFAGGLTLCYMLKIFVAVFIEKNNDESLQEKYDNSGRVMSPAMYVLLGILGVVFPIFGIFPHQTQDLIAADSVGFLNAHELSHPVEYFSWTNISGGLISICCGLLVYFLLVRTLLIRKQADGKKVYINAWSKKLDIEKYFYRPVLMIGLPFAGAFCARIASSVGDAVSYAFRLVFFTGRPKRFNPQTTREFSLYETAERNDKIPKVMSYSLLLLILGLTAITAIVIIVGCILL